MVAGIVFQLVSMLAYAAIGAHFLLRARAALLSRGHSAIAHTGDFHSLRGPEALGVKRVKLFTLSLSLATLAIIVRGIYRTAELAEGWHGTAENHEAFTIVLDVSLGGVKIVYPRDSR